MTMSYLMDRVLLPDGWARDIRVTVTTNGMISQVSPHEAREGADVRGMVRLRGPVVPGMANVHSHAFQRALAGLSEPRAHKGDDFWSWRQIMYRFVERLTPDQIEAIATHLYIEMLKSGYTAVGEFQYLHNAPDGTPYADRGELSRRHIAAARRAGIALTLLPVLYRHGNFAGQPPSDGQRRFIMTTDDYCRMVQSLCQVAARDPTLRMGLAPHSLRAVTQDELRVILTESSLMPVTMPVHIHLAEQEREVTDCLSVHGCRPGELLLETASVDSRWCLIHATHLSPTEIGALGASGAVAGLCPMTEANLGDGIFPLADWLQKYGRIGMGSDSHITIDPFAELQMLDYSQRLSRRRRQILADLSRAATPSQYLFQRLAEGGAQALAQQIGKIAPGHRADWVVLDEAALAPGADDDHILDSIIYARRVPPVRDVMVAGNWVVKEGQHEGEAASAARAKQAIRTILNQ